MPPTPSAKRCCNIIRRETHTCAYVCVCIQSAFVSSIFFKELCGGSTKRWIVCMCVAAMVFIVGRFPLRLPSTFSCLVLIFPAPASFKRVPTWWWLHFVWWCTKCTILKCNGRYRETVVWIRCRINCPRLFTHTHTHIVTLRENSHETPSRNSNLWCALFKIQTLAEMVLVDFVYLFCTASSKCGEMGFGVVVFCICVCVCFENGLS